MKVLLSLSGGIDSSTMLAKALRKLGTDVEAIGFRYGSKQNKYENISALNIAQVYGIGYKQVSLDFIGELFSSNLLSRGGEIPEGRYEPSERMSSTIVPLRNLVFTSVLSGVACSNGIDEVWLGIHQGDQLVYPDTRTTFFGYMKKAVEEGTEGKVTVLAPFLTYTKADIVREGLALGVPYHLTRTCYKDQELACGKCGACIERRGAFESNNVSDPAYEVKGVD